MSENGILVQEDEQTRSSRSLMNICSFDSLLVCLYSYYIPVPIYQPKNQIVRDWVYIVTVTRRQGIGPGDVVPGLVDL